MIAGAANESKVASQAGALLNDLSQQRLAEVRVEGKLGGKRKLKF